MHKETACGIVYSNQKLGIEEDLYQRNAHFVEEGKEKQVAPDMWIIGYVTPVTERDCGQVIIADSQGVLFVSQRAIEKRIAKSTQERS